MSGLSVARASTLARRHGMAVGRLGIDAVTWDGATVNLDALGRAATWLPRWPRGSRPYCVVARNLVHDVAHYLVAAPARRSLPNFGLGADQLSPALPPMARLTRAQRETEEWRASVLGRAMVHVLAPDVEGPQDRSAPLPGFGAVLLWLTDRGLLTPEGAATPMAMGRDS